MARQTLPGWPLLMDTATACRYLSFTRHQFRALIASGAFPTAIERVPGAPRWNRNTLDRAAERLEQREITVDHEREREETRQAIAAYRPATQSRSRNRSEPDAEGPVGAMPEPTGS